MVWYNEIIYMIGKWIYFWYINIMYLNLLFDKIIIFKNDEVFIKYNLVFWFFFKFYKMWYIIIVFYNIMGF